MPHEENCQKTTGRRKKMKNWNKLQVGNRIHQKGCGSTN